MYFKSDWYFCNIAKSGCFWKRLFRKYVLNNHFLKSLQKQPYVGVLRNFPIFTGKHLCWGLFLINLQALGPTTLFKRDFITGVSREYCEIFTNTNNFLYRTLRLLLLLVDKVAVQWWALSVGLLFLIKNINVGWSLQKRFVYLVRICYLQMITRNHSNTLLLINLQKTKTCPK